MAQTITLADGTELRICRNAFLGEQAWYCYFFGGRPTKGKEALDMFNRCEACSMAEDGTENPPSWMRNEDED